MLRKRKILWLIVALGALILTLTFGGNTGLSWLANHFGFALPGEGGLPYRIAYQDRTYTNIATCAHAQWCQGTASSNLCWQKDRVQQAYSWPLVQVGSIATLFGSPYPLMVPQTMVSSRQVDVLLYVLDKTNCYVPYALEGSP